MDRVGFKPETIASVFKAKWEEPTTKISKDAMKLSAEFMRLFVIEAIHRSAETAQAEGSSTLEVEHLQKILPQLLLDF